MHIFADTILRKLPMQIRGAQAINIGCASVGSDAQFFGRTGLIKYPFLNSILFIMPSRAFLCTGLFIRFLGRYSNWRNGCWRGYCTAFAEVYGNISYTRFIFNKNALIIKSASSNDINFSNSFDWKILKSTLHLITFLASQRLFRNINNSNILKPIGAYLTIRILVV